MKHILNIKTHIIMSIFLPKFVSPDRTDENLPSNSTFMSPKCSSILLFMSARIDSKRAQSKHLTLL